MQQQQECRQCALGILSAERNYGPSSAGPIIVNLPDLVTLPATELDGLAYVLAFGDPAIFLNPPDIRVAASLWLILGA